MIVSSDESPRCRSAEPEPTGATLPADRLDASLLSPSIARTATDSVAAYELKLVIPEALAQTVESWAGDQMQRDPFCDSSSGGTYQTTTLYLDTPDLDVFHRSPGFRRRKYRLRRYGQEQQIYLERKSRRGDRVRKRRCDVLLEDLGRLANEDASDWSGSWFRDQIVLRQLRPSCRVTYSRTAFVKPTAQGPLRLTLDRHIGGVAASDWSLLPVENGAGRGILSDQVVCEFKFREALPAMFKEIIVALQLQAGSMSKYRSMMSTLDGPGGGVRPHG